MPFKKGASGNPSGKPKGATNHLTRDVKEMILTALDGAGGATYLERQAEANPAAFLALVGKILPLQVTGEGGGPVIIVTGVQRADEHNG